MFGIRDDGEGENTRAKFLRSSKSDQRQRNWQETTGACGRWSAAGSHRSCPRWNSISRSGSRIFVKRGNPVHRLLLDRSSIHLASIFAFLSFSSSPMFSLLLLLHPSPPFSLPTPPLSSVSVPLNDTSSLTLSSFFLLSLSVPPAFVSFHKV